MANTPLPAAPQRTDNPDTFITKADAFIAALPTFQSELTAMQTDVSTNTGLALGYMNNSYSYMGTANAAAAAAQASAGATAWVSGSTYAKNSVAISQINFLTYRKKTTVGATTTDPFNDPTNWQFISPDGSFQPQVVSALNLDLSTGRYFTKTISANSTFTFSNVPVGGFSFTLELTVTAGAVTFPASVITANGASIVLTTGKTHMLMFVTSNGGTTWRLVVAGNYAS